MTADDSPITQRDLSRLDNTLNKLDKTIDGLRGEIKDTYVRKDVLNATLKAITDDVDTHSRWFTWAARLVVGAVILGLLALVIQTGGGTT